VGSIREQRGCKVRETKGKIRHARETFVQTNGQRPQKARNASGGKKKIKRKREQRGRRPKGSNIGRAAIY